MTHPRLIQNVLRTTLFYQVKDEQKNNQVVIVALNITNPTIL